MYLGVEHSRVIRPHGVIIRVTGCNGIMINAGIIPCDLLPGLVSYDILKLILILIVA